MSLWGSGDVLWLVLTVAEAPPAGVSDQLIIMVGGVITAAIVALGGVLVAIVNSRAGKTTASPPAPSTSADEHVLYERTAVLRQRADDHQDAIELIDRARAKDREDLDDVLGYLDGRDPGWRR